MIKLKEKTHLLDSFILDLLFPTSCLGCHKGNEIICDSCFKKIKTLTVQVCPICERTIMPSGKVCHLCKKRQSSPINSLVVVSDYQDKLLSRAIHFFKYKFVQDLAKPLGQLMCRGFEKNHLPVPDVIVPVPLHRRRLRWRGFNQSELLAQEVSEIIIPGLGVPVENELIKRNRYTSPQMKVKNYQERQKNLRDAFSINSTRDLSGKNVLIVDDICTTGSTILECAKEIKKLNPKSITAVVLARQN